jgi:hypothetical protein
MSRSLHTDPLAVRAARRLAHPHAGRDAHDPSRRQRQAAWCKRQGLPPPPSPAPASAAPPRPPAGLQVRAIPPRSGWHHPAGPREILRLLLQLPAAAHGLRAIELRPQPSGARAQGLQFGCYGPPGRIVLHELPLPPWRLPGVLSAAGLRCFTRHGAHITHHTVFTIIDWPPQALQRFVLGEVLLHELGHHLLQHHQGKRLGRIARTRDHEAFADRSARRWRVRVMPPLMQDTR